MHFNIAPKLGLIFMFLNDCDRGSFEKTSKKIFRDFASFVSKVRGVSSILDAQLCLTTFNTTENCKFFQSLGKPESHNLKSHSSSSLVGQVKEIS